MAPVGHTTGLATCDVTLHCAHRFAKVAEGGIGQFYFFYCKGIQSTSMRTVEAVGSGMNATASNNFLAVLLPSSARSFTAKTIQ